MIQALKKVKIPEYKRENTLCIQVIEFKRLQQKQSIVETGCNHGHHYQAGCILTIW